MLSPIKTPKLIRLLSLCVYNLIAFHLCKPNLRDLGWKLTQPVTWDRSLANSWPRTSAGLTFLPLKRHLSTERRKRLCTWLRECCRQVEAEVISNRSISTNCKKVKVDQSTNHSFKSGVGSHLTKFLVVGLMWQVWQHSISVTTCDKCNHMWQVWPHVTCVTIW